MDVSKKRSQHQIKNGDVILTYIGMLCMGKPQFDAVRESENIGILLENECYFNIKHNLRKEGKES